MGVHIKFVRGEKNLYVGKSVGLTSVYKTKLLSAKTLLFHMFSIFQVILNCMVCKDNSKTPNSPQQILFSNIVGLYYVGYA